MSKAQRIKKYRRVKGGEKNERSGIDWSRLELEEVCKLYIELDGKNIHENNPRIHQLAENLNRTIRSVENQLLGFRKSATNETGRDNYNQLIPLIWEEYQNKFKQFQENKYKELEKSKIDVDSDYKFRVSSQLKNIIGRDLITDDYLAIFELVKNSYDAHAKKVKITFEDDKIIIQDDGKGMSKQDIINKWLFVAYSAKKEGVEDDNLELKEYKTYRSKIRPRSHYAGAKGIGRFSTDRLGSKLKLTTRVPVKNTKYEQLVFNWDVFEVDALEKFDEIIIDHQELDTTEYKDFNHGVVLEISGLHSVWPRSKILYLKWSLEKLINPFGSFDKNDNSKVFSINIVCVKEKELDNAFQKENDVDEQNRNIVNGEVGNFVFETLEIKTTQIQANIENNGQDIITTLTDRGNLIYKIKEENTFNHLTNSALQLFYLNNSAKNNFTRLMGMQPVQFGNVFVFNNGFRVYPFGESSHDPFGIDRRKQQGYARNLGSRELIGRVEIWENSEQFKETSSRDGGLVETPGALQIEDFFKKTLTRLENYVSPILWKIKDRADNLEENIDLTARTQILNLVSRIAESKNIELLEYDKNLLNILNEKVEDTPPEIFDQLAKLAEVTGDKKFEEEVNSSREEYVKLLKEKEEEQIRREQAEEKAKQAEEKRREEEELRKQAEEKAAEQERLREEEELKRLRAEEELREENAKRIAEEQRRRQKENEVRFLQSVQSLDIEDVLNLHHQIGIDANTIEGEIYNIKDELNRKDIISKSDVIEFLDTISFANQKILAVTKFTTKQDFMAAARVSNDDIILYIKNYTLSILKYHLGGEVEIEVIDKINDAFVTEFKPIEISIIIDNLVSNSRKKNARKIQIIFETIEDNFLTIVYKDYGDGLDQTIITPDDIFNKGFTTTEKGSGLGLFHVRKILQEMGSIINVKPTDIKGIEFIIKLKRS